MCQSNIKSVPKSPSETRTPSLPDFRKPPVNEVALSAGFPSLQGYTSAHAGLFWAQVRERFVRVEEHPPIEVPSEIEAPQLTAPAVQLELMRVVPTRIWLLNETGTELIQVQPDRFTRNWRQLSDADEYPRYEYVRQRFVAEFEAFQEFARAQDLGPVTPNSCEVTYVNHVPIGGTVAG